MSRQLLVYVAEIVVDHAAAAASVGLELRPTAAVMTYFPPDGTAFLQSDQEMGLDLPIMLLAW